MHWFLKLLCIIFLIITAIISSMAIMQLIILSFNEILDNSIEKHNYENTITLIILITFIGMFGLIHYNQSQKIKKK